MRFGLSWPTAIQVVFCSSLPKFIYRLSEGSVMYIIQMVSTPHFYLKAVSLQQLLGTGKAKGAHRWPHLLDDLLQHLTIIDFRFSSYYGMFLNYSFSTFSFLLLWFLFLRNFYYLCWIIFACH